MNKQIIRSALLSAAVCALGACSEGVSAQVNAVEQSGTVQTERSIADGVTYRLIERSEPVAQHVHILTLDLDKVRLEVTPGDTSKGREFVARTPSAYVSEFDLIAGVNGGYFTPFKGGSRGGEDYYPHAGEAVDVSGASISNEVEASPVELDEDERVNAVICIEGASVGIRDGQVCEAGIDYAMAAGPRLLAGGSTRAFDDFGLRYANDRHPRTAVGLSEDGRTAWLVVVDGRQKEFSEGASLSELTAIFRDLGAVDAINLDGGGSTAMAVREDGEVKVVNSPIHTHVPGRERPSANQLGVRAAD